MSTEARSWRVRVGQLVRKIINFHAAFFLLLIFIQVLKIYVILRWFPTFHLVIHSGELIKDNMEARRCWRGWVEGAQWNSTTEFLSSYLVPPPRIVIIIHCVCMNWKVSKRAREWISFHSSSVIASRSSSLIHLTRMNFKRKSTYSRARAKMKKWNFIFTAAARGLCVFFSVALISSQLAADVSAISTVKEWKSLFMFPCPCSSILHIPSRTAAMSK